MNLRSTLLASALALGVAGLGAARAQVVDVPLTPGSGWSVFYFYDPNFPCGMAVCPGGSTLQDISGDTLDYQFTIATPTEFRITDGYFDGDQFDLTINKVDQGPTSTPTFDGKYVGDNWSDAYFFNPDFSHQGFDLAPGSYNVTGVAVQIDAGFGVGAGAVSLGAVAIPEPATWAMMLIGFAGVGALARRRSGVRTNAA